MPTATPTFALRTLDDLAIEDESSFRHVALYADLKKILKNAKYPFRVMPKGKIARWDHALLLNLTFWAADQGGDVLVDDTLAADVVAHVAWHHLAAKALSGEDGTNKDGTRKGGSPSADALFFGEAIASAFDVYLVARLLGHAPSSSFLETQVPAMADVALDAGLTEDEFDELLQSLTKDPERAFEDLRQLLFDATSALFACQGADEALVALGRFDGHRFAPLLHRYELSNWVLYARAHAGSAEPDPRVRELDQSLREAEVSLDRLTKAWVDPALRGKPGTSS
jgi:hypothetical protein